MHSNFSFLESHWPDLALIGYGAEQNLHIDPDESVQLLGMLGQRVLWHMALCEKLKAPRDMPYADLLRLLRRGGMVPKRVDDLLYSLRRGAAAVSRGETASADHAGLLLSLAHHLCVWLDGTYGDTEGPLTHSFTLPEPPEDPDSLRGVCLEQKAAICALADPIRAETMCASLPRSRRKELAERCAEAIALSGPETQHLAREKVRLEPDAISVVNYALHHNRVPIVRNLTVIHTDEQPMEHLDLHITSTPELCLPCVKHIDFIPGSSMYDIRDIKLLLNTGYLSELTEKCTGVLHFVLTKGDTVICREDLELTVLAFDQWQGSGLHPEMLTAFVTPNHPAVAQIAARAARFLEQWTGDPSLDAYQTGDPNRVLAQAGAVYAALQEQNIVYAVHPASFERIGQRVRLCDTVLEQKMGTCLDLTLFYASCLESIGLHPILILQQKHIFAGVWLEDMAFPESVLDDASLITKRMSDGINEIALCECTLFTAGGNASFTDARAHAVRNITGTEGIEYFIDVHRARLSGILPLPQRVLDGGRWQVIRPEADPRKLTDAPAAMGSTIDIGDPYAAAPMTKQTQWERKLLDLGLRNQLINMRLTKTMLPLLTVSPEELENALSSGTDFSILARPGDWVRPAGEIQFETMQNLEGIEDVIQSEFKNRRLRSACTETDLSKTVKELYRSAKTALEENGANTLYLALGILRWYETPKSTKARYAPVVLLPVDMIRKSAAQGYVIRLRDDEAQMNITMLEKMKQDFGLVVNGLDPLPTDEQGIDIRKVFTILRKAVMGQARWDILECACLGVFSFSQFVMWNDIRNRSEDLKRNKIVRSLMDGRLAWEATPMEISRRVPEDEALLPLPADASQLFAIENASRGESFVLHGPPGTGKSQTITAMIANALAQNKTVLFVAEKMAALEVVQKRLEAIGIGAFCLELHSNKSKKRTVLEQLRRATEVTRDTPPELYAQKAEQISALRKDLDVYAEALHTTLECGMTVYQLISRYEQLHNIPDLGILRHRDVDGLTAQDLDLQLSAVRKLTAAGKAVGHPKNHPLSAVGCTRYAQTIRQELPGTIADYRAALRRLEQAVTEITGSMDLTVPSAYNELTELLDLAKILRRWLCFPRAWGQAENLHEYLDRICQTARCHQKVLNYRSQLLRNWTEAFLTQNGTALAAEWGQIQGKWFLSKNLETNKMLKRLAPFSKTAPDKDSLAQQFVLLTQYQTALADSHRMRRECGAGLDHLYVGESTDWNSIIHLTDQARDAAQALLDMGAPEEFRMFFAGDASLAPYLTRFTDAWAEVNRVKDALVQLLDLQTGGDGRWISRQLLLCDTLEAHASGLKEWITWNTAAEEARSLGLSRLVDAYAKGCAHEDVEDIYLRSLYQALAILEIGRNDTLNTFSGSVFDEKIARLMEMDARLTDLTRQEIFCRLASRIPNFSREAAHSSEVGILQRAIRSGGRGISIRKLFEQIPNLLPRLCPCMLMSPISAAQYLDPGWEPFHIVVFDEASQLTTSKAVGALARGRDAIIVGDPKQMPPTSFFATNTLDEDNLDMEDLESILDDCLAMNMPQTHLLWHYRSRHESLIAFSNSRFYENKLYTFPSVNDREKKVRLVSVDGVFQRGKNRCNREEAEAIVEELRRRCHDPKLSKLSVGVVTFNISQQNLIDDLLTEACRTDPELEKWVLEGEEPVFIKNLENVQGDERDVILFSIGYGPDENGKVYMNFGPLNREGGWRRLNVAVSRSRQEMVVFSTLTPEQIDLSKTSAQGVAALKEFLEYAGGKELPQTEHTAAPALARSQGIAQSICAWLEEKGYTTDRNVGHSEYRIDVGVVDPENPEQYLLGILLDGESYGSAKTTRDREIAQIGVLRGLGWTIHRVWSMDWWDNREKELDRIAQTLNRILETRDAQRILEEESAGSETVSASETETPVTPEGEEESVPALDAPAPKKKPNHRTNLYKTAALRPLTLQAEDLLQPRYTVPLQSRIQKVLDAEAPISESLLIRRVVQSCGITRSGSRIQNRMTELLRSMPITVTEQNGQRFLWKEGQDPATYHLFRVSDREETRREAKDIPVEEAAAAVLMTIYEQGGLTREDLVRESAKLMGFTRPGSQVTPLFETAIFLAEEQGLCLLDNNGRWALTDAGIHTGFRQAMPQ